MSQIILSSDQSLSARQAEWRCLVGLLLALYRGPQETSYTPKTCLAGFLLAEDTGGNDLTTTGDRWRQLQVGKRPEISLT